jgi:serine/threonine protein kinase
MIADVPPHHDTGGNPVLRANERIGPYQLIDKLGKGGFGEVWLAKNTVALAAREVALKIPLDDNVDLDIIRQEAAIWIKASGHPNVLPIIEANVYEDYVVIASEYAPDGSLDDWLRKHGGHAPSVEAAVEMTRGILAGLEHLHSQQIIHRDLKPANILLQGATPRITDFGISRVFKSTSQSAVMAGTPAYMAPEAFNRKRNQQTDLWSVGVILYQMLTGRLPFGGNDLAELYGAILNDEPGLLSGITPERLRQVVAKALAKDPARRYQSAAEMRANLIMPVHDNEVGAQPPRVVVAPPQPQPKPQLQNEAPGTMLRSQTNPRPGIQSPLDSASVKPAPKGDAPLSEQHRTHVTRVAAPAGIQSPTPAVQSRRSLNWFIVVVVGVLVIAGAIYLVKQMPRVTAPPDNKAAFIENLNGVMLEMIRVPGGSFMMGSTEREVQQTFAEAKRHENDTRLEWFTHETPQHQVTLQSFYIGKYEVTQAQWKAVMGNNPSHFKGDDNGLVHRFGHFGPRFSAPFGILS